MTKGNELIVIAMIAYAFVAGFVAGLIFYRHDVANTETGPQTIVFIRKP